MSRSLRNLLIYHIHDRALNNLAKSFIKGNLIDIGCGEKPYAKMMAPFVSSHVGVDHSETLHDKLNIDRLGTAYNLPANDMEFDSALCTTVLEHLEEPEKAIRECYRVLKTNGVAIYSVPFIWHIHEEPRDFYRYTKYGLDYLFKKVGFEIIEIKALSGFWVTFGQLFVYNLYRFNVGPLRWFFIIDLIGLVIQGIAFVLDKIDKTEQWTWAYLIVVRKTSHVT